MPRAGLELGDSCLNLLSTRHTGTHTSMLISYEFIFIPSRSLVPNLWVVIPLSNFYLQKKIYIMMPNSSKIKVRKYQQK